MGWLIMNKEIKEYGNNCIICGKPVLEKDKFYYHKNFKITHAVCEWEKIEKKEGE